MIRQKVMTLLARTTLVAAMVAMTIASACAQNPTSATATIPAGIFVREGCELSIAITGIDRPRYMALDKDSSTLYLNSPYKGVIYACKDKDGDGVYETRTLFKDNVKLIVQMQFHDGWLWYGQTTTVSKSRDTNGDDVADETVEVIKYNDMAKGNHWYRPLLIHNNRLYTGIGDQGNITETEDKRREKIFSYDLNGKDEKLFVSGIRNNECLVVRPGTDEIWGVDNGSDWWGNGMQSGLGQNKNYEGDTPSMTNLIPPEEVNHYVEGGFYGHPYFSGRRIPRLEYLNRPDIGELAAKTTPPEWCAESHWAALSMIFYTGDQFPFKGDAFIAYHGSWNRQPPDGYRVTRLLFDNGHPYGELTYINFLPAGAKRPVGRAVGLVEEKNGSILVSDDTGHKVYRLKWKGAK